MNFVDFPSNLLSNVKQIVSKYIELKGLEAHSKMNEGMRNGSKI